MSLSKHTLHVTGMHCKSCPILVKEKVSTVEGLHEIEIDLKTQSMSLCCTDEVNTESVVEMLNPLLQEYGYKVHTTPPIQKIQWGEYILALVIAAALIYGFIELQQLGLLQMLNVENRTYGTSFLIGLVASVSSCLAVVGGVVLALGTVYSQSSFRPHSLFHIGRLGGFFVLGGILGLIGSAFQLSQTISIILNMVIAIVLLMLGLNLLGVTRGGISLGGDLFKHFKGNGNSFLGPLFIGIGTFFLPCGFTQSMQVYALGTGSFVAGGLTMLSFALGTLPMLLLLSVTGKTIQKSSSSNLLFKTIGIILVVLAVYNFASSLVAFGVIPPFFSF